MRKLILLLLLLGAAAHADTPFYTENWSNLSHWTTQAGSPAVSGGYLYNSNYPAGYTRLVYNGTTPGNDYSVSAWIGCRAPASQYVLLMHYLRVNGNSWYEVRMEVDADADGNPTPYVTVYLVNQGSYTTLGSTSPSCGSTLKSTVQGSTITVSLGGST